MTELIALVVSIALVAIAAIFVAAEFSLLTVNRVTVDRFASRGDRQAKGIAHALRTLSSQLSGAQIGITVTNLAIGFLAEPAISSFVQGPLTSIGISESAVPGVAIVIGMLIATAVTMVFGELIPKNIAIAKPMATARFVQLPQRYFTAFMRLPIRLLNNSANFILKQFGVEPQEELASARSADELLSLVRRSAEKGTLPKETAIMMERSLTFGDLTALDVMTPRIRIKSIEKDQSVQDLIDLAKHTGLSKFPVTGKTPDDILGVVQIRQAITVPRNQRSSVTIGEIMRAPIFVPSTIELESLLRKLRKNGIQMAIVIDEFGGTDGLVTIEDLLEELVGEVHDEHDRVKAAAIRKTADGSWILSGLLRPDEIGEELGIFLPEEEEYETVAGLVADRLERIPEVRDYTTVKAVDRDGAEIAIKLRVERMDGRRVDRLRMSIIEDPQERV
jgi:CBS domain containing-hemolysin-like protein